MGLGQLYLDTGLDKIQTAIKRIQDYEPPEGYYLAFSGGKDSITVYDLAVKSGVKFDAHYNNTGIDAPELVQFIKKEYPLVIFEKPLLSMWQGIMIHGLPLRKARWCCQVLKEHTGDGRLLLTGIRWQESIRRRKRAIFEDDGLRKTKSKLKIGKKFLHPIIDWTGKDVWDYIKINNLKYCSLYNEGYTRIGCILCPFSSGDKLKREMERYPKFVNLFRLYANRYYEKTKKLKSKMFFKSGDDYFNWWLSRGSCWSEEAGEQLMMQWFDAKPSLYG